MDEHDPRFGALPNEDENETAADEEVLGAQIAAAGPRPPIPPEALAALAATARAALRAQGAPEKPIENAARTPRTSHGWRRAAVFAASAALLLAALGFGWFTFKSGPSSFQSGSVAAVVEQTTGRLEMEIGKGYWRQVVVGERLPKGVRLRTESGALAALRMAGGATVRVDALSRVQLLSAGALRLDRGALYADTGFEQPGGPALEVRTAFGTVRHVGTQFEVRWIDGGRPTVRVRVREGSVAVEGGGRSYRAAAGEEISVRSDGEVARAQVPGYGAGWEWMMDAAGGLEIEGQTLGQVLDRVQRETGWRVRFADSGVEAAARRIVLHGGVGALRPDQAAFAILPSAGFEGELEGGVLVVRVKTPS